MNLLVVGASRGLGHALAAALPRPGDVGWLVSRTPPPSLELDDGVSRQWVRADLLDPGCAPTIRDAVGDSILDAIIYNAGIWEAHAFSADYSAENVPAAQTRDILRVNLESAITVCTALLPALSRSTNGKVVLIGSVAGLENTGMKEVAYGASKFGLRGAAHALRESLRSRRVAVTVINPGSFAASEDDDREDVIPLADLVKLVACVLALTNRTCVKEIDVPAILDCCA